jgi:glycosyltransferase involved in cell wall biosynthesis
MSLPRISVIIPCYNYARYVGQAIDSVVEQGYPALDLVVVNDGSTDDSLSVIRHHARGAMIIDQPNRGQVATCNAGFAASTGDIVIFLDADDLLESTALAKIARAWTPDLAKVQYDLMVIDADGRDLGRRFGHFRANFTVQRVRDDFARTATYRWPVTSGNAYSRWFVSLLFPQSFRGPVDGYLNTIAPVYGDVRTLPEVLGRYRLHGSNMSSRARTSLGFAGKIANRRLEVAEMRRHAVIRGLTVPDVDALDHELPFLNYRLMAVKLGMRYDGWERDRSWVLLLKGLTQLRHDGLPPSNTAMHAVWLLLLAVAPRSIASRMIRLRFDREQRKPSWRFRRSRFGTGEA